jgi:hypothetical protein
MSDETEISIELGPKPKIGLGLLNLTISAAAGLKIEELKPPAGVATLFVIFAITGMLVGIAAAFKSAPRRPLLLLIPVVAGLSAALWYTSLVAAAGLTTEQLYLTGALYVGTATMLAYVLTSVERILVVRQLIPVKKVTAKRRTKR